MMRALDKFAEVAIAVIRKDGYFDQGVKVMWKFVVAKPSETK